MGMFDIIVCEAPLPDGFVPPAVWEFQTKDTDEQYLDTYVITADGRLMLDGVAQEIHGDIEFYGSTISGCGPGYYITNDDKPVISRSYRARFSHGKLESITLLSNDATEAETWKNHRHIRRDEWGRQK